MRNLSPFKNLQDEPDSRDIARARGQLTREEQDAIHLAEIVNHPGWQVLKALGNGTVGAIRTSFRTSIDSLIGYLTYSIVRDGIENVLNDAEQVAYSATPRDIPTRNTFQGR